MPEPSDADLREALSIYMPCPTTTQFVGTILYVGIKVFNMGDKIYSYEDHLMTMWKLSSTGELEAFFKMYK